MTNPLKLALLLTAVAAASSTEAQQAPVFTRSLEDGTMIIQGVPRGTAALPEDAMETGEHSTTTTKNGVIRREFRWEYSTGRTNGWDSCFLNENANIVCNRKSRTASLICSYYGYDRAINIQYETSQLPMRNTYIAQADPLGGDAARAEWYGASVVYLLTCESST